MQFDKCIEAKVINKRGEQGEILSIDEQYVTVEYEDDVKTYSTPICFRSFLSFIDESLNNEMKDYLSGLDRLEEQKKIKVEQATKDSIERTKLVEKEYAKTMTRARVFAAFFGTNYKYKPLEKFKINFAEVYPGNYWMLYSEDY